MVRRDKADNWLGSSTVVGEVGLDCAERTSWGSWNKRLRFRSGWRRHIPKPSWAKAARGG